MGLNPVIAVVSKFYARNVTIDTTDFFGFYSVMAFNPLNASTTLEFSITIQSF